MGNGKINSFSFEHLHMQPAASSMHKKKKMCEGKIVCETNEQNTLSSQWNIGVINGQTKAEMFKFCVNERFCDCRSHFTHFEND